MKTSIALVVSVVAIVATTTAASAGTPVTVKGTQTVIDEKKGQYEVQGSLVGSWTVTAFTEHYVTKTQYAGTGRELFRGCHDTNRSSSCDAGEPSGSIRFVFTYWATFRPNGKLVRASASIPSSAARAPSPTRRASS